VPSVAVTSPGNMTAMQTSTSTTVSSTTVSASADAMNGDSALTTLALYADGVEIGGGTASPASATWSPSTAGEHALTAVATYANGVSVTSPVVDVYSGTLSVTAGGWEPDPAYVGQIIGGDVSATVSGGLDSDGSGPFYATFDWETARVPVPGTTTCETMTAIWESPDGDAVDAEGNGPTAFTTYSGSYSLAWLPYTIAKNRFDATFNDAGYYILKVQCTASIHDSRTGSAVGSLSSSGYVGGTASDVGEGGVSGDMAHAMLGLRAHAYTPSEGGSPPVGIPLKSRQLQVVADVYIPSSRFQFLGITWFGDGRVSRPRSPRYRLEVSFTVDPATGDVHDIAVSTTYSRCIQPGTGLLLTAKPTPTLEISGLALPDGSTETFISATAHDALFDILGLHVAPAVWLNIDVHTLSNHKAFCTISYPDYPATEAYIYYPSGAYMNNLARIIHDTHK